MSAHDDPLLEQMLDMQRQEASQRASSLGPVIAAAGMVRESSSTARILLEDLETRAVFHLEILDALLRRRLGSRWWEQLTECQDDDLKGGC